jgi:hypothetical protein
MPSVTRVHVADSVTEGCTAQTPVALHLRRVTVLVFVAVVAQVFAQLHADHVPYTVVPQGFPVGLAVHVPGSSVSFSTHCPVAQVKVCTVRLLVPVLVQLGGSTQGPQGSATVAPHVVPFCVTAFWGHAVDVPSHVSAGLQTP